MKAKIRKEHKRTPTVMILRSILRQGFVHSMTLQRAEDSH